MGQEGTSSTAAPRKYTGMRYGENSEGTQTEADPKVRTEITLSFKGEREPEGKTRSSQYAKTAQDRVHTDKITRTDEMPCDGALITLSFKTGFHVPASSKHTEKHTRVHITRPHTHTHNSYLQKWPVLH